MRLSRKDIASIVRDSTAQVLAENSCVEKLLLEMPYHPNDFKPICDAKARNAYIHLCKILLFEDSTRNASDWLNQTVNNFITPMITSKITTGDTTLRKLIIRGFKINLFGTNFEDYRLQMKNFCQEALGEVQAGSVRLYNKSIYPVRSIGNAVTIGKDIVNGLCSKIDELISEKDSAIVTKTLQKFLRGILNNKLGLDLRING